MFSLRVTTTGVLSALGASILFAQQPRAPVSVRAIAAPAQALPSESASRDVTKFSFVAYGDTRGQADGEELQIEHGRVMDAMLATIKKQATTEFPVRFVLQSGDAVTNGSFGAQWNVSFTPIIERLTREGGVPYFFAVGNHDVGGLQKGDPDREARVRNTASAMATLWPPEGSLRRLDGYPTFAFGYGSFFFVAFDSNIPLDDLQLAWVTRQLEGLDRSRYRNIVVFFHHPPITSGLHGGATLVEPQSAVIRERYLPLFRTHHVRMTIAGHDHLLDHWVEHYQDRAGWHRMDHLVTAGGGAPIYTYRGEPDVRRYAATAAPQVVRVDHLARPGRDVADNPHHFVLLEVDGDRIWIQAIGTGPTPFLPYGAPRVELADR